MDMAETWKQGSQMQIITMWGAACGAHNDGPGRRTTGPNLLNVPHTLAQKGNRGNILCKQRQFKGFKAGVPVQAKCLTRVLP